MHETDFMYGISDSQIWGMYVHDSASVIIFRWWF